MSQINIAYQEQEFLDNEKAFAYFFNIHTQLLYNVALTYVGQKEIAQDCVQDVFSNLWAKRQTYSKPINLKYFLVSCVKNKCLDELKRRKLDVISLEVQNTEIPVAAEKIMENKETGKALQMAIEALSPQCRVTFVLCRFEGFTYAQASEVLNISPKTVENHMGRALKFLRQQLSDLSKEAAFYIFMDIKKLLLVKM
jgi:RNA polymerase sigma-70 factor (ECF subfamily)